MNAGHGARRRDAGDAGVGVRRRQLPEVSMRSPLVLLRVREEVVEAELQVVASA